MLLPKQIWKDIEGYEGKYQVSNTGKVRSLNYRGNTGKTKVLKQDTKDNGYKIIDLYKNGKRKDYLVHRLVALAFIPNPLNLPQVNHIDEDKTNNAVWNLEWCTPEYNLNYGTHNEKMSVTIRESQIRKGKNNPNAKPILMFTLNGVFIKRFECCIDANEYLGKPKHYGNIRKCARGEIKTAYGYIWKYE